MRKLVTLIAASLALFVGANTVLATPPVVTAPANITVSNAPNQAGAVVNYPAPIVTDVDNNLGTTVCVPASGSFFPLGTTTVTCTHTDLALETGSDTFTITVNDTQPPTITAPANITVSNAPNQAGAVVVYPAPVISDNAPGVTAICSPASGSFFPIGVTTITCTATDGAGNTATATFTIRVNDTQPPTITAPANITVSNTVDQAGAFVIFGAPIVSDNAPGVTYACTPPSGSFFPIGQTIVTCTATDGAGNTATASFRLTVIDTQPPTISGPSDFTVYLPFGAASMPVSFAVTASDNAPGVTIDCTHAPGSSFAAGATTVSCTATDAARNTATTSFTITVVPLNAIRVVKTVFSISHRNGAPGAGVKFTLTGCGESRSGTTAADGTLVFMDVPPCSYLITETPLPAGAVVTPAGGVTGVTVSGGELERVEFINNFLPYFPEPTAPPAPTATPTSSPTPKPTATPTATRTAPAAATPTTPGGGTTGGTTPPPPTAPPSAPLPPSTGTGQADGGSAPFLPLGSLAAVVVLAVAFGARGLRRR